LKELKLNVCGTELTTFMSEQEGEQFVALKPLCQALGINYERQRQKIQKNPQFTGIVHMDYSFDSSQKMLCIPVREIGMWICSINAKKVKPDVKEKVIAFQKYLQEVIYQALFHGVTPKEFCQLKSDLQNLTEIVQDLLLDNKSLRAEVQAFKRMESVQKSAAGSYLANSRWAKKDRKIKVAL